MGQYQFLHIKQVYVEKGFKYSLFSDADGIIKGNSHIQVKLVQLLETIILCNNCPQLWC